MINVRVEVTNLDNTKARLAKLGETLHDFTEALTSLGTQLMRFYSDSVFNTSGGALGERWAELKPATEAVKTRKWPGRGILQRSGHMQESFYNEVTPDSLFISNRATYFPYHQLGTATGSGRGHNIPARPMIGVNAAVESLIRVVIEADIRAKIDSTNGL